MAVLLGLLFAAYFVLGGLDYGVAMTGRDRGDLDRVAPFFLANEVWLVGAVGFMLGAYPESDGQLLGMYRVPAALALVGVVTVMAAYGMRLFTRGRALDVVAKAGGLLAAAGWGYVLGGFVGVAVAVVLLAAHGWAFLRGQWALLAGTSLIIVVAVIWAGTRMDWQPADASTLAIVVPVAYTVIPLLILIQAVNWWMFRIELRRA